MHSLSIGLKHVEDEPATWLQVLADALQAIHLLAHFPQVLKRPEGNDDEAELLSELKLAHVALDEMDALTLFLVEGGSLSRGSLKHAFGEIQSSDTLAYFRERHGDAAGAAAEL